MLEWECKQTRKNQKRKKYIIFSGKYSLLLSASIKTKVITHCSNRDHNNSHSMSEQRSLTQSSFLQQWSFTDVIPNKATHSHSCHKTTIPINYNIDNRNCKYLELKRLHTRARTSLRCSECQPDFKKIRQVQKSQ